MPANDIKETLKEIKKESEQLAGWDDLKISKIDKYETEAVVYTSKGTMKISMRELFVQYNFRMRVFEIFAINLEKVKDNIYHKWLTEWSKNVVDMGMEYGTSLDRLKELLSEYLETAEETDISYLKKGFPIILPDGSIGFKSLEFTLWTKKKYGMPHTETQVRAILSEIGCSPRQIGPARIRVWSFRPPEIEEEPTLDLKFESKGKAPDFMNDEFIADEITSPELQKAPEEDETYGF